MAHAELNMSNSTFDTALTIAAHNGHLPCVRLLLEHGAQCNQSKANNGFTALMIASQHGHESCVRLLLEQGANVLALSNDRNINALILASVNGHPRCIQQLIDAGANADTTGVTLALFRTVLSDGPDYIKCIRSILAGGGAEFKTTIIYEGETKTVKEYACRPEIRTLLEEAAVKRNHLNALPNDDPNKLKYLDKHPMHFQDIGFDPEGQWSHAKFQNRLKQQIPCALKMSSRSYHNLWRPRKTCLQYTGYVEAMVCSALLLVSLVLYFKIGVGLWLLLPMLGIIVILQGLYRGKDRVSHQSAPQPGVTESRIDMGNTQSSKPSHQIELSAPQPGVTDGPHIDISNKNSSKSSNQIKLYDLLIHSGVKRVLGSFLDKSSYYRLHFSKLHAYWAVIHIHAAHAVEALVSKITQIDPTHDSNNKLKEALLKLYPWSSQEQLTEAIQIKVKAEHLREQVLEAVNGATINDEYNLCLQRCPSLDLPKEIKADLCSMLSWARMNRVQ